MFRIFKPILLETWSQLMVPVGHVGSCSLVADSYFLPICIVVVASRFLARMNAVI